MSRGAEQPVVTCCQAGCAAEDVLAALGLTMADISANGDRPRGHETGHSRALDLSWPWMPGEDGTAASAIFTYYDEHSRVHQQVLRGVNPKTGRKDTTQRRPDPNRPGHWKYGLSRDFPGRPTGCRS